MEDGCAGIVLGFDTKVGATKIAVTAIAQPGTPIGGEDGTDRKDP